MNAMYSLYIPRAMTYTTSTDVERVFNALFGKSVKVVVERELKDSRGQSFKGFAIHFENFAPGLEGMTAGMRAFDAKMQADGEVKVMTGNKNWFWKVKRYIAPATFTPAPEPRIMTEEDERRHLEARNRRVGALAVFSEDELEILDEAAARVGDFSDDELDELDAAETHAHELELAAIADEMASA